MNLLHRIAAALTLIVSAAAATAPAQAATVHLGNVTIGEYGSIANSVESIGSSYAYGYADGYLPANSMITFTYNTPILPLGTPIALGAYASVSGGAFTTILSINGANSGSSFQIWPPAPMVFVPPSVWPVMTIVTPGTAIIKNLSNTTTYFSSYFLSLLSGPVLAGNASTYIVSSVPLPASLLLMLTSVAGLGGMAARRKKLQAA